MQTTPIISMPPAAQTLPLSAPTITKSIDHMIKLGLLREITGKLAGRHRPV
jgi:hypothetical protein